MKVLRIHAWAVLPDDFSGSMEDALRYVADYRPATPPRPSPVSAERAAAIDRARADLEAIMWPLFHEAFTQDGAQQLIAFSVDTLEGGVWTRDECRPEYSVPMQVAAPVEPRLGP
jgi:hypothetical protein